MVEAKIDYAQKLVESSVADVRSDIRWLWVLLVSVFCLSITSMLFGAEPTAPAPQAASVDVIDGDTFRCAVAFPWGAGLLNQTVRCLGYDAPEISKRRRVKPPVTDEEIARGAMAKSALRELLKGRVVYLVPGDDQRDAYGRILARAFSVDSASGESIDVAARMHELGFGSRTGPIVPPDPPDPQEPPAIPSDSISIYDGETFTLTESKQFRDTDGVLLVGPGATLDLAGHTIEVITADRWGRCGVYLYRGWEDENHPTPAGAQAATDCAIRNGTIRVTGPGAQSHCIYGYRGSRVKLQNLWLECEGEDSSCIYFNWEGAAISGCTAVSRVTKTADRHVTPGVFQLGIGSEVTGSTVIGGNSSINIGDGSRISGCFLSPASFATNGYCVGTYKNNDVVVENNVMVPTNGRGVILQYGARCIVRDNVILAWENPNSEYGDELNACGVRCRYDASAHQVVGNRILAIGGGQRCSASCLYLSNNASVPKVPANTFERNHLTALICGDYQARKLYAKTISLEGQGTYAGRPPVEDTILGNTILGNHYLLSFSGYDGGTNQSTPIDRPACGWTTPQVTIPAFAATVTDKLHAIGLISNPTVAARWAEVKDMLSPLVNLSAKLPDRSLYFPVGQPPAVQIIDLTKSPESLEPIQ